MKFEKTEVWGFGWAKKLSDFTGIPRNQIVNTVRRFDELNKIAFCDKRRK